MADGALDSETLGVRAGDEGHAIVQRFWLLVVAGPDMGATTPPTASARSSAPTTPPTRCSRTPRCVNVLRHGNNVTAAARAAGVDRIHFYRPLWRHGLR